MPFREGEKGRGINVADGDLVSVVREDPAIGTSPDSLYLLFRFLAYGVPSIPVFDLGRMRLSSLWSSLSPAAASVTAP